MDDEGMERRKWRMVGTMEVRQCIGYKLFNNGGSNYPFVRGML